MLDIQKNVPLAPLTTFRIGGPAKYFVEVSNEEMLLAALRYAKSNNLEIFILSGGSNVLISDKGFDGLVIRILSTAYRVLDTSIRCDAGLLLSEVVRLAAENSLLGLEWAAGIPGTIGGAIRGNAGAYGGAVSDIVQEVRIFDKNKPEFKTYSREECAFSYRSSLFKKNKNLIIISALLRLRRGEKEEIESRMRENLEKRRRNQPKGLSAGSFFENPTVSDKRLISNFEKDTGVKSQEGKIPAGWLIAEAGLLGKKIGGVKVSEDHGNFVINTNRATAEDVIILTSFIKQQVRTKLGVQLKEEVQLVGF